MARAEPISTPAPVCAVSATASRPSEGTLAVESLPGDGTRVLAELPLRHDPVDGESVGR